MSFLPLHQRIEESSFSALPAAQTLLHDGWLIRMAGGGPKRANSVNPLAVSTMAVEQKFSYCKNLFARQHIPLTFRLTGHAHNAALDIFLEQQGLVRMDDSIVMTRSLEPLPDVPSPAAAFREISAEPWFTLMHQLDSASQERKLKHVALLKMLALPAIHGCVGEGAAIGLGVVDGDYAGIFDITTDPAMRRQGHARALTLGILQAAKQRGATTAYLQVVASNAPAISLYESMGFTAAYRYWYRCRP
ncbi:GNAT family N-acetyltransferase [Undibacterium sp.]|uniref:GNAT family N-acetyltransferase n=1 Tax=Undibacterium sp. TaxID=1914977 RepID=UPI00374DEDBF